MFSFRTIEDLNRIIKSNIYKIQKEQFDLVVAVPRSGFLPASIIALYLNLPLTDFDSLLENKIFSIGKTKTKDNWIKNLDEAKKILIVEDSSASGNSLKELNEKLKNSSLASKCKILTIFVTEETKNIPDFYFDICPVPRLFEWNYIHHKAVRQACFDIDGVLCEDPTEEENDDGEKYVNFIRTAPLKFSPTFTIGYLVTSRLEKYRKDTEFWLENNNIKYNKLIMLDLPSKEERMKLGNHGSFKGETYKKLKDTNIFIESEQNQAIEIAKISGKPVFCTSTSEFITEKYSSYSVKSNIKTTIKKFIPKNVLKILKKLRKK